MKKFLLNPPKNLESESLFWSIVSNTSNSVISVLLLWSVTRINGPLDAGVFSLGFSTAQMMLAIGNYGMRNFQASDVTDKYTQSTYFASRILTSIMMIAFTWVFVFCKGYDFEKSSIILLLCIMKVMDAVVDVFGGYYQRMGRLDLAGKVLFTHVFIYSLIFIMMLFITKNMYVALVSSIVVAAVLLVWMVYTINLVLPLVKLNFKWKNVSNLLVECFPLSIGAFMIIYLGNAPKYAIDSYMTSVTQAYYNYLFMPCFVINLFVSFALQPLLVKLSLLWNQLEHKEFKKICLVIYGCTVGITLFVVLCGRYLGCFLLSFFYGVNLSGYRNELTILLVGGGMFALAVVSQTILTIMRHQYSTLIGFTFSSVLITIVSPMLVKINGISGAAWSYTICSAVLFVIFIGCVICFLKKEQKNGEKEKIYEKYK